MAKKITAHQYWFCNPFSWFRLLIQNKGVDFRYFGKALIITFISLFSYPIQLLNSLAIWWKGRNITDRDDPVFIIGHWRGGTTFLQYLLAEDPRFGFLTYYHAFIPNLAIIGGNFLKRIFGSLVPVKRPQDNIHITMDLPTEEENPLSTFSPYSASHSFFFPRNESYYKKFVLFEDIDQKSKFKWQKAYTTMLRRILIHQQGKQLLIKNPHNTGRVKELLEIYPKARFIHIHRNPYELFPSTFLMYDRVVKTQFLQDYSKEDIELKIIYYFKSIMAKYFVDRELIPKDQLVDLAFEALEKNPIGEMQRIYQTLGLPLSEEALSRMKLFLKGIHGYQKNVHQPDEKLQRIIEREWAFGFEKLGYPLNQPVT